MALLTALISWYLLLGLSESLNINKYAINPPHSRQTRDVNDDNAFTNEILTWTCPMEDSFRYISESDKWYTFLNSLFCKFSDYKIQASRRNYNVSDIEEWGNPVVGFKDPLEGVSYSEEYENTKKQGIMIDRNNFQKFLNITETYNITENDSIKNITITELKLKELNNVLDLTIKQRIHISCKEPNIFIKGNYVLISEIYHNFWKGITDDCCKNFLHTNEVKFLNIFALNTLFIDDDMPATGIFEQIVFIAPKWHIIGKRKIKINGKNGESQSKRSATRLPPVHGKDGKPGKPGGPGGNFFGIGEKFINAANLTIAVNGGNGSPGEEGKNGRQGNDGTTPMVPSGLPLHDDLCDNKKRINGFKCELIGCIYHEEEINSPGAPKSCKYKLFGKNGAQGGDGGNGGKGGRGGKAGYVELVELNNYSGISQVNNSGQDGIDGRGASGGLGGKRGNDIVVRVIPNYWNTEWSLVNRTYSHERNISGQTGLNGANYKKMKAPKTATALSKFDQAKIINQYKSYLRENLNGRFKSYHLLKFLKLLENNNKIKSVYDTLGFTDELQNLESTFYRFNKNLNLLPFYQSLLNRINEYAQNPSETVNSSLLKKVLGSLGAAILGRIYNLEAYLESSLITNITAYLESVKTDIEKLKNLDNLQNMEEVINKYKQSYKNEIDKKMKEAIYIIPNVIIPEIDNISVDIDRHIESFINEITYQKQQARLDYVDNKQLNKKYQQLGNVLVLQNLISSLKLICQVVSFLGFVGVNPSLTDEVGGTDSESVIFSARSNLNSIPPSTRSVVDIELLKDVIKNIRVKKIRSLRESLESISLEVREHSDTLSDLYIEVSISDFTQKLNKITGEEINYEDIKNLEDELKATLQIQGLEITNPQAGSTEQKNAIQNIQKVLLFSPVILDYYNKYKYNQSKIDIINNAIKQKEYKFYKFKQYEDRIYNMIVPMLQNIQNHTESIVSNLGKRSKVVLDVPKLKSTLGDMIVQMQQLAREVEVKGDLSNCIEKMEEATVTLINLQDHIEEYQAHEKFANVISEINSIPLSNTYLENDLKHALRDLQIIQRSSIVMQRYKVAINAFKEFVFPFAHYFLSMLTTHLKIDGKKNSTLMENLVFVAMTQIDQIKSKLEEFKESVKNPNECIGKGDFKSNYVSSEPFFVWNNEQHKSMISKLLSGETVTVKADIKYSSPDKDAIKVNILDFNFKSKDEIKQLEVKNAFKGFQITTTHLGNSYYRYDNKTYLMMTPNLAVWYSFERKPNGEPVQKSISYDLIKIGDFMLSPYACWKIKLHRISNNVSFRNLEKYKNNVHLQLEGYGHYINNRNMYCSDLEVDKYYKAINTYNEGYSNFHSNTNW